MNEEITFFVVRHGKTLMNTLNKIQGWCDSPLTKEGIESVKFVGLGMKDISFRSAYCSTLRRTKQTAELILEAKGQTELEPIEIEGFKEAGFGSFESETTFRMWESAAYYLHYTAAEQMSRDIQNGKLSYRKVVNAIKELDRFDMAESFEELEARTQESFRTIAEAESQKGSGNILIVSHGMSMLAMLLSLGGDKILKGHIDNAGVCKVIYKSGDFIVESMNDNSYLEKGKAENT